MSNKETRDLWDAFKNEHIEYFKSNEEIWHDKLEEVKSFFEIHGKRPSNSAKNETEKILASWISTQIQNRAKSQQIMSNKEFRDLWDAFISEHIEYFKSNEEIWREKLEEAKLFFERHGKRPSTIAKNGTEKILCSWISTQVKNREKCQKIMSNKETRDLWDAFISEHIEYLKSNEDIWRDKLEEAKSFFEIHGKRPSKGATKDGTEKILAEWISTQIENRAKSQYIMSKQEICDLWDAFKNEHIEYFKSNEDIWRDKLEEVKSFFKIHGKRPSHGAKNGTEKILCSWISTQIQSRGKSKDIMSNKEFRDLWDAFISEHRKFLKSNEEIWRDKLEEVKLFFEMHGKRPSQQAKDETEKVLGCWISQQLTKRAKCKESMSEFRDLWDAFISDNGKYFKSKKPE